MFVETVPPDILHALIRWNPSVCASRRSIRASRSRTGMVFLVEDILRESTSTAWRAVVDIAEGSPLTTFLLGSTDPAVSKSLFDKYSDGKPMLNVLHGALVTDQQSADEVLPHLEDIGDVTFVLASPLEGLIDLRLNKHPNIRWVITAGGMQKDSTPSHPLWVRALRNQCVLGDVAFFFEGWGAWKENVIEDTVGETLLHVPRTPTDGYTALHVDGRMAFNVDNPSDPFGRSGSSVRNGWTMMRHVGATNSGRVLDKRTWDEAPMWDR